MNSKKIEVTDTESVNVKSKYIDKTAPAVTVLCLVYNHTQFLRECLDSLVCQKTSFRYQIIVHDDASTDGSANIILDYYQCYPELILPVLQTENQYSKGVKISQLLLKDYVKSKYVAICEGDDYWCNPHKLQLQYDYMEKHPDCALCAHNTKIHHMTKSRTRVLFNYWLRLHKLTDEEVFIGWHIHESSFFFRSRDGILPEETYKYWFGDYVLETWLSQFGYVVSLPIIMSTYRAGNPYGINARKNKQRERDIQTAQQRSKRMRISGSINIQSTRIEENHTEKERIEYLRWLGEWMKHSPNLYNDKTGVSDAVSYFINSGYVLDQKALMLGAGNLCELIRIRKEIRNSKQYSFWMKKAPIDIRCRNVLLMHCLSALLIWRRLKQTVASRDQT